MKGEAEEESMRDGRTGHSHMMSAVWRKAHPKTTEKLCEFAKNGGMANGVKNPSYFEDVIYESEQTSNRYRMSAKIRC